MYTLIGGLKSRAFRVLWMLEELGAEYQHQPEPPRSDRVRALNPSGKIPVLLDGDDAITDSTAILTYLADKHGALTHPAGTLDRARQDAVTHMLLDEIDGCLWTAARHSFVLPEDQRCPEIKPSLKWEFARSLKRLGDRAEASEFLAGDRFTVADIIAAHCLGWAGNAGFPVEDARATDYLARMRARPAFRAAAARL